MTEDNVDIEYVNQLISTLRLTVANQQIDIVDLKAQLSFAESKLEKLQNPED